MENKPKAKAASREVGKELPREYLEEEKIRIVLK